MATSSKLLEYYAKGECLEAAYVDKILENWTDSFVEKLARFVGLSKDDTYDLYKIWTDPST